MATNLQINDALLAEAQALAGLKTKRETVDRALEEFIKRHRRRQIWDLEGTVVYEPGVDYKTQRGKR